MAVTTPEQDLDQARDRLRDERAEQLSFELGIPRTASPDFASLKISGDTPVERDLRYGEHVTVTVTDRFGEVVAEVPATVGYPTFKDHFDKAGTKTVERVHVASLD